MTDSPAETPAAFNGHNSGTPTHAQRTADAAAAIAGLLPQLPQAVGMIVRQVLQQTPVQTRQHLCAHCVTARLGWEATFGREMQAAIKLAAEAAGIEEGDPRWGQLDPAPHLPERLRPGMPQGMPPLTVAVTTVNGTEVCSAHLPGRPGGQQLLVASAAFSPSMLAGLG